MTHQEYIHRYINDHPNPLLLELPQNESMIISTLKPLSTKDYSVIADNVNAVEVFPSMGVFIPDGKWGATVSFGPCSLAILTGLETRIWMGHLKPGQSLPDQVIPSARPYMSQRGPIRLTLMGGCDYGDFDMNAARKIQFDTISRQFSEAHLDVDLKANWNPYRETWLTAFVQSLSGCADVYVGFER